VIVLDQLLQGSEAWEQVRLGRATASEFDKILTPSGAISKQAIGYMRKLAREVLVDNPNEWQGNRHTDWGNEHEADARRAFTDLTGLQVTQVGFVARDDEAPVGCSPDGLIMNHAISTWSAGLELKCPAVDTHVGYIMEGRLPNSYKLQVHGSMAVTGLDVWYFFSYFPGLNPFLLKVERDDFTEKVGRELDKFIVGYADEREAVKAKILPRTINEEVVEFQLPVDEPAEADESLI